MIKQDEELILRHYREQAEKHGDSPSSTMEDLIVRERELEAITVFLAALRRRSDHELKVLDLGCGNGYALGEVSRELPLNRYWGLDFSEDLLEVARGRGLPRVEFASGDARALPYETGFFDAVYTERCLINILETPEQIRALQEVARVLKPGGHYLMLETFTDGFENYNRARQESGLDPVPTPYHNLMFNKKEFLSCIEPLFEVVGPSSLADDTETKKLEPNFLSSHFFIARVLHPVIVRDRFVRNSEFVRFFSQLVSHIPPCGNYSPIQAYILRKQ